MTMFAPAAAPRSTPLAVSQRFAGIRWTGRFATYTDADTWYPSWDADGHLYSPFTDGDVDGVLAISRGPRAQTGHAVIEGDDPMRLRVRAIGVFERDTPRFRGNYPCGSLCHRGVWYYGSYYLDDYLTADGVRVIYEMGPCAGFRISTDHGQTWTDSPRDDHDPLFPERGRVAGEAPIRFGAPKFVDFGQDMQHAPDGKAYLVAHGTLAPDGVSNWCAGDAHFLARVAPSPETINDPRAYEFFAGLDAAGGPRWSNDFAALLPIVDWPGHAGIATVTYNAPLGLFLLVGCVGPAHGSSGPYDTWIATSQQLWGPWELVQYLPAFGTQGYFATIPSKFIAADGWRAWLVWSANWSNKNAPASDVYESPPGSRYTLAIREFELVPPGAGPAARPGGQP